MQPAGSSDVANTLREYANLLQVSGSAQDKEDIYTPLRGFLNSFRAETVNQPGVRESLARLRTILQKDPNASDIIRNINNLSQQTHIAPTPKAAAPAAPAFADRDELPRLLRNIKFTFTYADGKDQAYKDRWKDDLEAAFHKESFEPLARVLDYFEKAPDAPVLKEAEIQQQFKDTLDLIKKHPSTPKDLVQRLEQFNKRFDVKGKPEFVRFTSSEVNIKRNLLRQLQIIAGNMSFYTNAKKDARYEMEFYTFCSQPLQRIIDQLRELPEKDLRPLLSQKGVNEALSEAVDNYEKSHSGDEENIIENAKKLIKEEEPVHPKLQPLPSHALNPAEESKESKVKEEPAHPNEKIPEPLVFSGEPSAADQRTIDHLADFLSQLQEKGQINDPNLMLNITIAIKPLPDKPHPEIQNLVKELAAALKEKQSSGDQESARKRLLESLEKKIEKFNAS